MAKVILKWRYIKPGAKQHNQNLVKYIAKRDGVDKIDDSWKSLPVSQPQQKMIDQILRDFPDTAHSYEYRDYLQCPTKGNASEFITRSLEENLDQIDSRENYVQYIAKRPRVQRFGTHGLFTDSNVPINLDQVAKEVANHDGILMTQILSLRREDAARLGYEKGEVWRETIRSHADDMAKAMRIPIEDLRWYAAFHNEGHHPHCHIIAYSVGEEPYMTQQGLLNLKSAFARSILRQDLLQIYDKQTRFRNELGTETKELVAQIVKEINEGTYHNDAVAIMLRQLSEKLRSTKGKKIYGYLSTPARNLVNAIVDELAEDTRLEELYALWYSQRDQIVQTYQDDPEDRLPLSQNKTFHSIKNIIVKEALNIAPGAPLISAEELAAKDIPEPLLPENTPDDEVHSDVFSEPIAEEFPDTMHASEKVTDEPSSERFRPKPVIGYWWTNEYKAARKFLYGTKEQSSNFSQALVLMTEEAEKGNGLAMHDLGKMYLSGLGCEKDGEMAQKWFSQAYDAFVQMEQADKNKDYWQYRIGKLYSFGHGVEKDYMKSAEWFAKAVADGNPFAAYSLGGQYYHGQGVEQDYARAFELYTQAATHASKPNAYAQYQLGRMCKEGAGTDIDDVSSEKWYRLAYRGFQIIEQTMADDRLYYRLGQMNRSGTGTATDLKKAREYFEKAAELDNVDALYSLGKLYLREDFIDRNSKSAVEYLLQAVEKEHIYAQYQLGKMYLFGHNVVRDEELGKELLRASAAQGNIYAQRILESYGKQPIGMLCFRLLSNLAQIMQENIEKEQQNVNQIDRKLRRKIAEKKQLHGQRMG